MQKKYVSLLIIALVISVVLIASKIVTQKIHDYRANAAVALNPDLIIYDDALRNSYQVPGQSVPCIPSYSDTNHFSGSFSMRTNLNGQCTINLYKHDDHYPSSQEADATFSIDNYNTLEFDIYGNGTGATIYQAFHLSIANTHYSSVGVDVPINNYVTLRNGWQHVVIPLSAFGVDEGTDITGISVQADGNDSGMGTVLFDNLKFRDLADTVPPTLSSASNTDLLHLALSFNEKVSTGASSVQSYLITSSNDPNYGTSGLRPSAAALDITQKGVTLTLPRAMINGRSYSLSVSSVQDLAGNIIINPNQSPPNPVAMTAILQTASITISAGQNTKPFSSLMRGADGAQWMHAANVKPYQGAIPELTELAAQMKLGLYRQSGGNWANAYIWDPTNTIDEWSLNTPGRDRIQNAAQMDSLALFRQATGTDVMIQVNVCTNNPQMWVDMYNYVNVTHNYGFKYWEVGSENNYDTCDNLSPGRILTPSEVATRVASYATALRAAAAAHSQQVYIVGPSTAGFSACPDDPLHCQYGAYPTPIPDRFYTVMQAVPNLDFLSWHHYPTNEGYGGQGCFSTEAGPNIPMLFNYQTAISNCLGVPAGSVLPDDPTDPLNQYTTARRRMAELSASWLFNSYLTGHPNTKIGITELNTLAGTGTSPLEGNHAAALWFGDMLGRMASAGYTMNTMYNFYDGYNYGIVYTPNDVDPIGHLHIRPTYYTMMMYGKYFGDQMVQATVNDPSDPQSNKKLLTAWVSKDSTDPTALKLMVTNFSPNSYDVGFTVTGYTPVSGSYYELTNPAPLDIRGSSSEDTSGEALNGASINTTSVNAIRTSIAAIPARTMTDPAHHTFPGYTLTSIVLRNTGTPPTPTTFSTPSPTNTQPSPTPGIDMRRADINHSGVITIQDLSLVKAQQGHVCTSSVNCADVDCNGTVDISDLTYVQTHIGLPVQGQAPACAYLNVSPTPTTGAGSQRVTFDDYPSSPPPSGNIPLSGSYPAGMITWGANWQATDPTGGLTSRNFTYTGSIRTSTFTFSTPKVLVSVRATDPYGSSVTFSCAGQPTVVRTVPASRNGATTLTTGWSGPCTTVTLASTGGNTTNFDDLNFQ